MSVSREMLVAELRQLLRLTAFEQTVATVRRTQARSTPIEHELAENAAKSGERIVLLRQAVRQVGGVPDLFAPFAGRAGAILQAQVNQVQTLQGALLGDLALEHQLRDRARYARTLAVSLGEGSVLPLLDRLETAHSETIGWLEARLAEVGRTGTSALKATPVQQAVGGVRRVATAPLILAAAGVNRAVGLVGRFGRKAPDLTGQAVDAAGAAAGTAAGGARETAGQVVDLAGAAVARAADTASSAAAAAADAASQAAGAAAGAASTTAEKTADMASSAADATSRAAGAVAGGVSQAAGAAADTASTAAGAASSVADQAAQVTSDVLERSGGDDVANDKPPFAAYERLTGDSVIRHVNDTDDVAELRTLLAYEQAHKARKGVLAAAQDRLKDLSASV